MKVIRTRMPAVEAAIARFDGAWQRLSGRERALIGVLALLLGGAGLVYGVIGPLQTARAEALKDIRTYETLIARVRAAGTLTSAAAAPRRRTGTPEEVLRGSAQAFGLTAEVQAIPGGARARIAQGSYDALLAWLADLGATSSLRVARVIVTRGSASGQVAATVDFGA